jgi:hypothetical protein
MTDTEAFEAGFNAWIAHLRDGAAAETGVEREGQSGLGWHRTTPDRGSSGASGLEQGRRFVC